MKRLLIRLLEHLLTTRPQPAQTEDIKWDALDGVEFSVILPASRPPVAEV